MRTKKRYTTFAVASFTKKNSLDPSISHYVLAQDDRLIQCLPISLPPYQQRHQRKQQNRPHIRHHFYKRITLQHNPAHDAQKMRHG